MDDTTKCPTCGSSPCVCPPAASTPAVPPVTPPTPPTPPVPETPAQ